MASALPGALRHAPRQPPLHALRQPLRWALRQRPPQLLWPLLPQLTVLSLLLSPLLRPS
jgi:hypothetical protein